MYIPTGQVASLTTVALLMIVGGIILWKIIDWNNAKQGRGRQ